MQARRDPYRGGETLVAVCIVHEPQSGKYRRDLGLTNVAHFQGRGRRKDSQFPGSNLWHVELLSPPS